MLRISKMADYGVVIMTLLATLGKPVMSAAEIGERANLTLATVSKLLKRLVQYGLLTSQRGIAGGYALAKTPECISLADVIEAIDGPISMTECNSQHEICRQAQQCHVKNNWVVVNTVVQNALKSVSLVAMSGSLQHHSFGRSAIILRSKETVL